MHQHTKRVGFGLALALICASLSTQAADTSLHLVGTEVRPSSPAVGQVVEIRVKEGQFYANNVQSSGELIGPDGRKVRQFNARLRQAPRGINTFRAVVGPLKNPGSYTFRYRIAAAGAQRPLDGKVVIHVRSKSGRTSASTWSVPQDESNQLGRSSFRSQPADAAWTRTPLSRVNATSSPSSQSMVDLDSPATTCEDALPDARARSGS